MNYLAKPAGNLGGTGRVRGSLVLSERLRECGRSRDGSAVEDLEECVSRTIWHKDGKFFQVSTLEWKKFDDRRNTP